MNSRPDLSSYATSAELTSGLAGKQDSGSYATSAELTSGLAGKQNAGSYATSAELTSGLAGKQATGSYATSAELTSGLAGKQATGSYATSAELTPGLAGKQATIGSSTDLSVNKVTFGSGESAIEFQGSYDDLNSRPDLSSYATSAELTSGLAGKQDSGSYATTTQLAAKAGQGDPMTCVTAQVTGNAPIYTTGAINIDNAATTYVPFAGSFTTNGVKHPNNSSLFIIIIAAEYTVNVQLRVTNGGVNERGMYWVVCRRYKQRSNSSTRGTSYRDYYLGSSFYRDDTDNQDDIVLGGNVRVHFEASDEQFEIVVQRAYTQQPNTGNNPLNNNESCITVERHAYEVA